MPRINRSGSEADDEGQACSAPHGTLIALEEALYQLRSQARSLEAAVQGKLPTETYLSSSGAKSGHVRTGWFG